ncbi:MAG: hypothetical protein IIX57_03925 [Lachnospiraceae bacterium]|nr:hypothetical protein [Lachnospiraceae bacterium]
MKKREWLSLAMLACTVVPALLISYNKIFRTGIDGERFLRSETQGLLLEVAILFGVAFAILMCIRNQKLRIGVLALEAAAFTWIHQAFLPMVVSGLYLMVIICIGSVVRRWLDRDGWFEEWEWPTKMADFTLGSIGLILLYGLMSLIGIGSIPATRAAAAGLGIAAGYMSLRRSKKATVFENTKISWPAAMAIAFVIAMLLLQVGRMNICADYDSLHYGLRSEYVFNDGDGIFENMGSINVVYTYSKGLETLLLPISGLPSYSFFLSFQGWMTQGILMSAAENAGMFVGRNRKLMCKVFQANITAITNMGITAKTDSATCLFQMIMTYFLLRFVKERKTMDFAMAGNAFLMTMVLKPTALAFSTVLAGTVFVFLFVTKSFHVNVKDRALLSWIPAIAMWLMIWARTMIQTGIPVTSVLTSIWTKLGFTVKYPFMFDGLPSNGGGLGLKGTIKYFLKRLYGVLLAPVGEDMAHVRIAWGTSLLLVFLVLFLTVLLVRMKVVENEERRPLVCLVSVFFTNGIMSLVMLYLLWQVDGNYFLLLYCLFSILAVIVIGKMERSRMAGSVVAILVPMLLFNVAVTAVSNWSGTLGLSPIKFAHKGYYDHWAEAKVQMEHKGNVEIWDILAEDPETRVLVYGEQPEMLMFPCNAQSYTDIAGSGGNYYVSASARGLVEFFDYAKIDYVYLCGGYLKPGTEAWNFVAEMIELGHLTNLYYENGHVLAEFAKEPVVPNEPKRVLYEFAQCYYAGEQM